jgi:pyruvate dehydrogenase E2 component (dihydrolipoamide acetyltransferase)
MVKEIILPKLGITMTKGTITKWFVTEGDCIKKGEPLLEVLVDLISMVVEAENSGTVLKIEGEINKDYSVFDVIGYLGEEGETIPINIQKHSMISESKESIHSEEKNVNEVLTDDALKEKIEERKAQLENEKIRATPAARRLAKEQHILIEEVLGTGPKGRIQEEDILGILQKNPERIESPNNVIIGTALEEIIGDPKNIKRKYIKNGKKNHLVSGKTMTKRGLQPLEVKKNIDFVSFIEEYSEEQKNRKKEENNSEIRIKPKTIKQKTNKQNEVIKKQLIGKEKIIADRMIKSHLETAVMTLSTEIDMTEIKTLRKKISKKIEEESKFRCTYTDFLLMAVTRALKQYPIINSSLINNEIITYPYINIGLAVSMEQGLIIPVIRNTQDKNFVEMVKNRGTLLKAVKNNYILPEELKGSTFSISNLGMYGIREFSGIINQPNSAILCVGEVVSRMRLIHGEAQWRFVMNLSLSFDHRVSDGVMGAKFLKEIKGDMENPALLLF